jgi:25S rRNA (cytosine2870-C5)-methyltransferase
MVANGKKKGAPQRNRISFSHNAASASSLLEVHDSTTTTSSTKSVRRPAKGAESTILDEDNRVMMADDSSEESAIEVEKKAHTSSDDSSESGSKSDNGDGGDDDDEDDNDGDSDREQSTSKPTGGLFSDQNVSWLKPKERYQSMIASDDEEEDDDEFGVEDEVVGRGDEEEEMEVERASRLLDERHKKDAEEAEKELREMVAAHTATYILPSREELERDVDRVVPPSELKSHIESILEVLSDFNQRREPGRSRKEYVDQLGLFIAELHGYLPELIEYFLSMFSPSEALEFVEYSDKPRPMVIRTNTLKTRRKDLALSLIKRGVSLDPLANWSKVGLKISESPVPIGATPEYLSGHYMLQSAASMCPVLALSPQPKERILDMSAAPGGKTSYLAQLMRNTGVIFANDLRSDRQKATVANLHRLGVKNVVTCTHDGRKLPRIFQNYKFDRVLLDAPCSGLGVISRDPSCKVQRTIEDVKKTAHLQKELLLAAIDVLNHKSKTGGIMVYSTCSVSVFENEEVVDYALKKRDVKIIDTELDFGTPGFTRYQQQRFHPSIAATRRFYPHVHNMDGFFVARIQKLSDKIKGQDDAAATKSTKADKSIEAEKAAEDVTKTKGKKRKVENQPGELKSAKKGKVSFPPITQPSKNTQKKSTRNAKLTKPRRKRIK